MKANKQAIADRAARHAARLARALLIYGLLVGGAAVFLLPFLWMLGTSLKVDREMFGEKIRLFPGRPIPTPASPYLDSRMYRAPDDAVYPRVAPLLRPLMAETDAAGTDDQDTQDILLPGLYQRLRRVMPAATWQLEEAALREALGKQVTPDRVDGVLRRVRRRLTFGSVRVRSFDVQEKEVTTGQPIAGFWNLESTVPASLDELDNTSTPQAQLSYDFREDPAGEIRLSHTITLPFLAERLYRIQISLQPDDTWHPLTFLIEYGGKRYRAKRPEFLGNFEPMVVTLQEVGPDDAADANKIKLWIPYQLESESPDYESRPDRVRVTMVLRKNSPLGAWWAKGWRNYRTVLDYIPFWRYAATSALLVILNIVGNVLSCSLVAYAFARLRWPGRNLCFGLMMATLMIPPQVTMIPFFLIMKSIGWYNTLTPLWFISFFGNAFNIFLLRQFMKGIPRDLEDAARIDGCNFLQIYWYVMMPLIKPTLACIAIFTFMAVWNDFMGPLIFLADQRLYPLSLGLYALNVQGGGNYGMMMAGSLLMTLPVILIFFFAQKYFIQGIALTGTKG